MSGPRRGSPAPARAAPLLLILAACSRVPDEQRTRGVVVAAPSGMASPPAFSREAFAAPPGDTGDGGLVVPTTPDPTVLDEILAMAPGPCSGGGAGPCPRTPGPGDAGPPRGGLLGSDTGVPLDAGAVADRGKVDTARIPKVSVGKITVEPGMSAPAIERAARAQLYWSLVQRCRDGDGAILPPEVVHLAFHLDGDGYIVPATVVAVPREARFADAARCMARELSMAPFRAPAAARGQPRNVFMDVPSVD